MKKQNFSNVPWIMDLNSPILQDLLFIIDEEIHVWHFSNNALGLGKDEQGKTY